MSKDEEASILSELEELEATAALDHMNLLDTPLNIPIMKQNSKNEEIDKDF